MNRRIEWARTTGRMSRMTVTEDVEVSPWIYAMINAGQFGMGAAQASDRSAYNAWAAYSAQNSVAPQVGGYGSLAGIFGSLI